MWEFHWVYGSVLASLREVSCSVLTTGGHPLRRPSPLLGLGPHHRNYTQHVQHVQHVTWNNTIVISSCGAKKDEGWNYGVSSRSKTAQSRRLGWLAMLIHWASTWCGHSLSFSLVQVNILTANVLHTYCMCTAMYVLRLLLSAQPEQSCQGHVMEIFLGFCNRFCSYHSHTFPIGDYRMRKRITYVHNTITGSAIAKLTELYKLWDTLLW